MADEEIPTLNTKGYLFTSIEVDYVILRADYGEGLEDAITIGDGLRSWSMKIDVLPDRIDFAGLVDKTQFTRAAYLWQFFQTSKRNNNAPFWFRFADPGEDARLWLASFTDDKLSFSQLCDKIFGGVGLTLKQRSLRDQESPSDPQPVENPDQV